MMLNIANKEVSNIFNSMFILIFMLALNLFTAVELQASNQSPPTWENKSDQTSIAAEFISNIGLSNYKTYHNHKGVTVTDALINKIGFNIINEGAMTFKKNITMKETILLIYPKIKNRLGASFIAEKRFTCNHNAIYLENSGTMELGSLNIIDMKLFNNDKQGIITIAGTTDIANVSEPLNNKGTITFNKTCNLGGGDQLDILNYGSMVFNDDVFLYHTRNHMHVNNFGDMHFNKIINTAQNNKLKIYNYGTITLKNEDLILPNFLNQSSATIKGLKTLKITNEFENVKNATIIATNVIFNSVATNDGTLFIGDTLKINQSFVNTGTVTAKSLPTTQQITFINNEKARAKFTSALTSKKIIIENTGSMGLHGMNTINSYTGDASSELVLTLPTSSASAPTQPLLTLGTATFTTGAKIILAADQRLQYLNQVKNIIILQAENNLTLGASPDEILHSRVYYSNNNVDKTSTTLSTNSILIKISNVSATAKLITANLQMGSPSTLPNSNVQLATSLLGNKILKVDKSQFSIVKSKQTTTTTTQQKTAKQQLPTTTTQQKTAKQQLPTKTATKPTVQAIKIDNSGVEHRKLADNHCKVMMDIIQSPDITAKTSLNTAFGINSGDNATSKIWCSFNYYYINDNNKNSNYQYKWQENTMNLGIESQTENIKFGWTLVYQNSKSTTKNNKRSTSEKTSANSFIGLAHIVKPMNDINFSCALMYGGTNNQADSCKYTSNEYSVITAVNYNVTLNRFKVSTGLATQLIAIHIPDYTKTDSNNTNLIKADTQKYMAASPFIAMTISHKLSAQTNMVAELRAGYLYIKDINHKNEIELVTSFAHNTQTTIIPKKATMQHTLYFKAKINMAINNLFYGVAFNWNHNKNNNALGGMLVAGYRF